MARESCCKDMGIGSRRESALTRNRHHTTLFARAQWYLGHTCSIDNISGSYQPYVASHGSTLSPASTSFITTTLDGAMKKMVAVPRRLSKPGKDNKQVPYCSMLFIASARTPEGSHWPGEMTKVFSLFASASRSSRTVGEWVNELLFVHTGSTPMNGGTLMKISVFSKLRTH